MLICSRQISGHFSVYFACETGLLMNIKPFSIILILSENGKQIVSLPEGRGPGHLAAADKGRACAAVGVCNGDGVPRGQLREVCCAPSRPHGVRMHLWASHCPAPLQYASFSALDLEQNNSQTASWKSVGRMFSVQILASDDWHATTIGRVLKMHMQFPHSRIQFRVSETVS